MTLTELYEHLEAAGFQRQTTPPEPPTEEPPAPVPAEVPAPANDAIAQLQASIDALTAAMKANAIKTVTFDNPPTPKSAEDILGEMLAGRKPE